MRVTSAIAIASLAGFSSAGNAQGAPADLPSVSVSAEIIKEAYAARSAASTKGDIPLSEIPQSVNVIPPDFIRDQGITSLQEALRNVPGVSQDAGDGQRDQFVIRGFSAVNDMYIDGMRDDSYYFRDLSNIDRIEILKGPSSVLYGRGSSGGLINRVTKKPTSEPVRQVGFQLSSAGQRRSELDVGTSLNNDTVQARLTAAIEDSDGFRNKYFLRRQSFAPSVKLNIDKDTSLLIQAEYLHDNRLADTGIPAFGNRPAPVDRGTYYGSRDATGQNNVESTVAGTTFTFDSRLGESMRFKSMLRAYDSRVERNYATFGATNMAAGTIQVNRATRLRNETGAFWQNELTHKFWTGTIEHEVLYGAEFSYQRKKDQGQTVRNVARYSIFNPMLVDFSAIPASAGFNPDANTDVKVGGLYIQDFMTFNPKWKLMVGGRYDKIRTDRQDYGTANLDLDRTDKPFSPRVGVVYLPAEGVSLYAVYSRSFQPMADNGELRRNSSNFSPEKTENKEIGLKLDVLANTMINLSLFEMQRTGILMDDPADTRYSISAGTQRTRGFEASVVGDLGNGWSTFAGYAYLDGVMVQSNIPALVGNASPLTPRHSANVSVKKQFKDGFFITTSAKYEAKRFTSPNNQVTLGSYMTVGAGAGYRGKNFDITVNVENLFDRRYYVSAKAGSDNSNYPGAPRAVAVRFDYRF